MEVGDGGIGKNRGKQKTCDGRNGSCHQIFEGLCGRQVRYVFFVCFFFMTPKGMKALLVEVTKS